MTAAKAARGFQVADVGYSTYSDLFLPGIVAFWNKTFRLKRNFFEITPELFRERVVRRKSTLEKFEPDNLVIANRGGEIVGMIHVGIQSEEFCGLCFPEWQGGAQGYVAFLNVREDCRQDGIGSELWRTGMERLSGCDKVIIDGQCLNPFYGNSAGPFTPFWGTTEGIGIEWDDVATRGFFAKRKHQPRYKGISLELQVRQRVRDDMASRAKAVNALGVRIEVLGGVYPELGEPLGTAVRYQAGQDFFCVTAIREQTVCAIASAYPMTEVSPDKYGIYELLVAGELQGKGIGSILVARLLSEIERLNGRACEVLTVEELSPRAIDLYKSFGFEPVAEWAVY
jgi:ribosomal protein S18 acetylase RimI-like enzyme